MLTPIGRYYNTLYRPIVEYSLSTIDRICKNCVLFDPKNSICTVTFIMDGEDYVLPTKPNDKCHLKKNGLLEYAKSIQVWSDGTDGYIKHTG